MTQKGDNKLNKTNNLKSLGEISSNEKAVSDGDDELDSFVTRQLDLVDNLGGKKKRKLGSQKRSR